MVTWVLYISPVGIASLIAASICRADNIGDTLAALGLWVVTVLLGLAVHVRDVACPPFKCTYAFEVPDVA